VRLPVGEVDGLAAAGQEGAQFHHIEQSKPVRLYNLAQASGEGRALMYVCVCVCVCD
jgi:hypothetical protein